MSESSIGPSIPDDAPNGSDPDERLREVRLLLSTATHQLLGDTITVEEDAWHAASRLPGWTRAHVATHLARQADALGRLVEGAHTGEHRTMYDTDEQRSSEIEAGASRSGLELQIDLDTAAGRLGAGFDRLDAAHAWDATVELRGGQTAPARLLPLARLAEVVLHHVDLDIGFDVDAIDPVIATWLLEWAAFRLRSRDFPALTLETGSGARTPIGTGEDPRTVRGTPPRLLGWLTGRSSADQVDGADGIVLPAY